MVDRVEHLFGRQPHVHRVQHRSHHRHREKAFEIAVGVPVHHGDRMPMAHAKGGERGPQPADPFLELAIGETALVCVDDLLVGRASDPRQQQLTDGQRIDMRARSPRSGVIGHVECLSFAVHKTHGAVNGAARGRPSMRHLDPGRRGRRSRRVCQIVSGPMDAGDRMMFPSAENCPAPHGDRGVWRTQSPRRD